MKTPMGGMITEQQILQQSVHVSGIFLDDKVKKFDAPKSTTLVESEGIENRRVSCFWLPECRKFLTLTVIEENAADVHGLLQNLLFGYHSADRGLHGTRLRM